MSSLAELPPSRDIKITVYPKNNLIFGLKLDKIIRKYYNLSKRAYKEFIVFFVNVRRFILISLKRYQRKTVISIVKHFTFKVIKKSGSAANSL